MEPPLDGEKQIKDVSQERIVEDGPAGAEDKAAAVPSYAWVILLVVFLASVAAPLNQNKVPPLMPLLMEAFRLDLSQAGMLMSIFGLTGVMLALPTAVILQKLRPKVTGLVALGCLAIGAALGALSTGIGLLLISRVIEGVGMVLIAVVAPVVIAMWFPPEKRGAPMGIWATWVPVGNLVVYNLAPALGTSMGWQAVWWGGAGFALVAFLLYWWLMRMPPAFAENRGASEGEPPGGGEPSSLGKALANRNIWLLALEFGCISPVFLALGTFLPMFLSEVRGYSLAQAASIYSLMPMVVLGAAPLAGWISDRIGSRRLVFTIPCLLIAGMMLLPFNMTGWTLYAFTILLGLVGGAIPTAIFATVPEVMSKPQLAGIGMAVVSLGQSLGAVIGPVLFGKLVESLNWAVAGYLMIPFCLVGFLAGWMVRVR
jgi:predicted MFS family arabinose efflux permease